MRNFNMTCSSGNLPQERIDIAYSALYEQRYQRVLAAGEQVDVEILGVLVIVGQSKSHHFLKLRIIRRSFVIPQVQLEQIVVVVHHKRIRPGHTGAQSTRYAVAKILLVGGRALTEIHRGPIVQASRHWVTLVVGI